jgi:hypothetical protein
MKFSRIYLASAIAVMALSACVSEELPSANKEGEGKMWIDVDLLQPQPTRAVDTDKFPVTIYKEDKATKVKEYETLSAVPNQITLPVGTYYVEAHTPGKLDKIMDIPYYKGISPVEIMLGVNTETTVTCRMANGRFDVQYSDDFKDKFASWTITIDDGTESAIEFSNEISSKPIYMVFEEKVKVLNVNFTGTTTEAEGGNTVRISSELTKGQADEQYDDDEEHFSGGDAIVLNFKPTESTEGEITGIEIKADITFTETGKDYNIQVMDKETPGGDNTGSGNEGGSGGGDSETITLDLPDNMVVNADTDPSLGDTYIAAPNGIKSIVVSMSSTSEEMMASLAAIADGYEGVDFANGTEVVGNESQASLFSQLGQSLSVPAEGDTEYTFPIGNFFVLLSVLPGEHSFGLTVTDMQGNTTSGGLTLTVEE